MSKAVILLSGGLDSLVALDIASKKYDEILALFFNYSQKSYLEEKFAVEKIAKKYSIKFEEIELPFLAKITNNSLVDEDKNEFSELKSVWIPNRNGLFLNIASCYCDSFNYDEIIFGANKEESKSFSDNKEEFVELASEFFKYSTMKHPKVLAPCSNMTKIDLVNYMIDNNLDFSLIKSCYQNVEKTGKKHCGTCMSCKYLYKAITNSKKPELIKEIF